MSPKKHGCPWCTPFTPLPVIGVTFTRDTGEVTKALATDCPKHGLVYHEDEKPCWDGCEK